jgi:hypothetical protein
LGGRSYEVRFTSMSRHRSRRPRRGIAFPNQRATKAALDNDSRSIDFFQREFQVFFIFNAPKSWKN